MIRLNVFVQVAGDNRAAVVAAAKELVAASLKDKGCVAYDVFESSTRPDVLMICETWQDDASLSVHQQAPHFTTLVPKIESMATMKIERFEF
ncbi:MAG TPA: antibiotic biosynthesis monooxygenase [Candidatus Phocaeicola gallistercoris]|jgi:quinol monooxygenase YgiN|nr:antibiotic biosynthesis monooxygenase [Candidatus Phocaeicola gallistercoris]